MSVVSQSSTVGLNPIPTLEVSSTEVVSLGGSGGCGGLCGFCITTVSSCISTSPMISVFMQEVKRRSDIYINFFMTNLRIVLHCSPLWK